MILFDFLFQPSPSDGYVPTKNALIAPFGRSKIVSGGSCSQPRPPAEVFVWHIPVRRLSIALNTNLTQTKAQDRYKSKHISSVKSAALHSCPAGQPRPPTPVPTTRAMTCARSRARTALCATARRPHRGRTNKGAGTGRAPTMN